MHLQVIELHTFIIFLFLFKCAIFQKAFAIKTVLGVIEHYGLSFHFFIYPTRWQLRFGWVSQNNLFNLVKLSYLQAFFKINRSYAHYEWFYQRSIKSLSPNTPELNTDIWFESRSSAISILNFHPQFSFTTFLQCKIYNKKHNYLVINFTACIFS